MTEACCGAPPGQNARAPSAQYSVAPPIIVIRTSIEGSSSGGIVNGLADSTARSASLPGASDPSKAFRNVPKAVPVYRWPREKRGEKGGIMHVKTVIQDRRAMLLSSANLTGAAFDRNMELGLLIEGGNLPDRVDRQFDELIEAEQLRPLHQPRPPRP